MKKLTLIALSLLFVFTGVASASSHGEGHKGKNHGMMKMMKHASPAPNLMKVIKKHADQLDLTKEQSEALAQWRKANHDRAHQMVKEIVDAENAINQAAMDGESRDKIMSMMDEMLAKRKMLVQTKIDCRDNMKSILNADQYKKVLSIYQQMMEHKKHKKEMD